MRIPDLTRMQVNTRVHEAMMTHLRGEEYVKTGFGALLAARLVAAPA